MNDGDPPTTDCRVCRLICRSLPPKQVLDLGRWFNHCVPVEDQVRIAAQRDPSILHEDSLDKVLLATLQMYDLGSCISATGERLEGIKYSDTVIQKIEWLLRRGANPRQPAIRRLLVTKPRVRPWESLNSHGFDEKGLSSQRRRVWSQTFRKFEEWSLDVAFSDFRIVSFRS